MPRFVARYYWEKDKPPGYQNLTSGYHYHTILADSEETLDAIEEELRKKGYLVQM